MRSFELGALVAFGMEGKFAELPGGLLVGSSEPLSFLGRAMEYTAWNARRLTLVAAWELVAGESWGPCCLWPSCSSFGWRGGRGDVVCPAEHLVEVL